MWAALLAEQVLNVQLEMTLEDEHRQLFVKMDGLRRQITDNAPISEQRLTLHTIDASLKANCFEEEAVMYACSFPFATAHEEEHRSHHHALRLIDGHIISLERDAALFGLKSLLETLMLHIREKDLEIIDWKRNHRPPRLQDSPPRGFDAD
jgi:hemerythrin